MSAPAEPEFDAEVRDDLVSLRGLGLGVAFRRHANRWADAILRTAPGIEIATSHFLDPDGDDPARVMHPVYQEVQIHGPSPGPSLCLLLTGLSFNHHFSAAVSLSRDPHHPASVLLDIDAADRCRSAVDCLAATYLVHLDSGALEAADGERIAWRLSEPCPGRLELLAGPDASLALAEGGRKATRVQILGSIHPGAFTHRLRYGWRWTSAEGLTR